MGAFHQTGFISHARIGDMILKTLAEHEAEQKFKTAKKLKRWTIRRWEYVRDHNIWSKVVAGLIGAFIGWIIRRW
jgi:hypothetical protein